MKRVPKNSRIPVAENLLPKINDICKTPSNIALWCLLLSSLNYFLGKPPRGGKRQRSSLSAIINKRIRDGVFAKKPKRDRKPQQKSELDRRLRSICAKLDEGNVKAGIRMAVGDDKIADFTVDNYAALKLKHPQRETCSVPDPTDIDCFSTSEFFDHEALMSFPNGSKAGLDGISPQILKDLTAKSNRANWTDFSQRLNKSCECDSRRKSTFRTSAVLLWCETNCAKKARWRTSSYCCRQYVPPIVRIFPKTLPRDQNTRKLTGIKTPDRTSLVRN